MFRLRLRAALLFAVLLITAGIAAGQTETQTPAWPSWCENCYRVKMILPGVEYSMEVGGVDGTGDFVSLDPLTFTWLRKSESHYLGAEEQFFASGYWYIAKGVKFDPKRYKESVAAYQRHLAARSGNNSQATETKLQNQIRDLQAQLTVEKQTTARLEAELAQAQVTIQKLSREAKQQPPTPKTVSPPTKKQASAIPPILPVPKAAATPVTPPKKQAAKVIPQIPLTPKTVAKAVPAPKKQISAASPVPPVPEAAKAAKQGTNVSPLPPPPQCGKREFSLATRRREFPANNPYSPNYAYCKAEADALDAKLKGSDKGKPPIDPARTKFILVVGTALALIVAGVCTWRRFI